MSIKLNTNVKFDTIVLIHSKISHVGMITNNLSHDAVIKLTGINPSALHAEISADLPIDLKSINLRSQSYILLGNKVIPEYIIKPGSMEYIKDTSVNIAIESISASKLATLKNYLRKNEIGFRVS